MKETSRLTENMMSLSVSQQVYYFNPRDWVWVKVYKREPVWEGPYQVMLVMLKDIKVARLKKWIDHSYVKLSKGPEWFPDLDPDPDLAALLCLQLEKLPPRG